MMAKKLIFDHLHAHLTLNNAWEKALIHKLTSHFLATFKVLARKC